MTHTWKHRPFHPPFIIQSKSYSTRGSIWITRDQHRRKQAEWKPHASYCFLHRFCSWVNISISTRWKFSSLLIQNKKKTWNLLLQIWRLLLRRNLLGVQTSVSSRFMISSCFFKEKQRCFLILANPWLEYIYFCNLFLMIRTAVTHSAGTPTHHQVCLAWLEGVLSFTKDPSIHRLH